MTKLIHTKIINKIAKQKFKPFGIVQKGQSRIWLDDRGWFTTIIEFQPYRGEQGSTLNIGVNFHWYKKDYFSFDIAYRQDVDFVYYNEENEEYFIKTIEDFCDIGLKKALEYRAKMENIHLAKEIILKNNFTSEEFWGNYHKGIICGLSDDFYQQNIYFGKLLKEIHPVKWVEELKENTNILKTKNSNKEIFTNSIIKIILETRTIKKLPEMEILLNK